MAVDDAHVFPGFLTLVVTKLFFPKPPTTFLTCFCRGERWKYAGKDIRLNQGSNSQPPGHESNRLTTVPQGWAQTLWPTFRNVGQKMWPIKPTKDFSRIWPSELVFDPKRSIVHNQCQHRDQLNPFPHNDTFWRPLETSLMKTLWERRNCS